MNLTKQHIADQELLAQLRAGSPAAYEQLYEKYSKRLLWRFRELVRDPEEAKELLQDLFIKVWERRQDLDIQISFEAYLQRAAQRMAVDLFRKLKRKSEVHDQIQAGSTEIVDPTEELIFAKETQTILYAAIAKLPEQRRKAFTLCKIEGKSHQEAADIMNISKNTVHNHLTKSVVFVKEQLEKSGTELSTLALLIIVDQVFW